MGATETPSGWASAEQIAAVAVTLTPSDIEALVVFADRVDALLIDETRGVRSGFNVRDARHNLLSASDVLQRLRKGVTAGRRRRR